MNLKGIWEVGLIKLYYPVICYTFNDEDAAFIINITPSILGYDEKHPKEVEGVIIYSVYILTGGCFSRRTSNNTEFWHIFLQMFD